MNQSFQTWTRQVAFNINLTEPAIQELLFQLHCHRDCTSNGKDPDTYPSQIHERGLMGYLLRRGMIIPCESGGFTVSKAGILTAQLLEEAGFKPNRQYGTMFPTKISN